MDDVSDIVRIGHVSSVNPANCTVRVAFDDMCDPSGKPSVSGELQVMQPCTGSRKDFSLPDVGEHVRCVFLANGLQEGFVDGSYYTAGNMPKGGKVGLYRSTYSDGAVIEYDLNTHTATVTAQNIKITGKVEITGDVTVSGSITATGSITGGN